MRYDELSDLKKYLKDGNSSKALALLLIDKIEFMEREKMTDGNVCGRFRAVYRDGRLCYEADRAVTQYEVDKASETRAELKRLFNRISYFCNSKEQKTDDEKLEIVKMVSEIREWCLENGFYGKALDFAKLLQAKFRIDGADTLEKAVRGYASRQLYRGHEDCSKKAEVAIRDAQLGKYGIVPRLRGRQYYLNAFNSTKISLPVKKSFGRTGFVTVGMDDYKIATSISEIIGPNK